MYALVGGNSAGMACGPFGPTVYSVARTLIVVRGWVLPSGITNWAWAPCGNSSVACRVPSASVTMLPRATWMGVAAVRSTVVTCGSSGIRTTSGVIT